MELFTHVEGLNAVVQYQASKALKNPAIASAYIAHAKQRTVSQVDALDFPYHLSG